MLFKNIKMIDPDFNVLENMYLGVKNDRIDYIGTVAPADEASYGRVYDGRRKLLMPGFYNAHAHSPMTLLRGYAENMTLQNWLFDKVFPFEDQMSDESAYYGNLLALAEGFRYGIVSSSENYFFHRGMYRAYEEAGGKVNFSRSLASFPGENPAESYRFKEIQETVDVYHNTCNGRLLTDIGIHAEYTNTEEAMAFICDYMIKKGLNMHVHVSETKSEHEECKQRHGGRTPSQLLRDLGAFETRATLAHCVWVEPCDLEIFTEKNITVATCPTCNLKIASGVANIPRMLDLGINVAIGTDGVASNNCLNFLSDVKLFAIVNKERRQDPTLITPAQALYAATRAGAVSQGRMDCGELRVGSKADLLVMDVGGPHMYPVHNMLNNLVYSGSGSDVVLTMVDGKVVYDNGEYPTIDIERVIAGVEEHTGDILGKIKAAQ